MANDEMKEFKSTEIVEEKVDLQAYINELVDSLRNDKEVYENLKTLNLSMKEVRSNITKLVDYQKDFHYCENCPGLNKCDKKTPHTKIRVYKERNYLSISHDPCQKIMDKMLLDSKYLYADFPEKWKALRIRDLNAKEEATKRPVIGVFREIVKGQSKRSVYLKGNHKVGKSLLLVTFANEFVDLKMGEVAVINSNKRFKELQDLSISDKDIFSKEMVVLSTVPLLIIDDFGQEYKSEYLRDQIVLPILTERCRNDLLTFFTSEFSIDEIQRLYSIGKNGGDIRGKQLGNVIRDLCQKEFDITGTPLYKK